MKFSALAVAALLPIAALAQPLEAADPQATDHPDFAVVDYEVPAVEARDLEKRAVSGKVLVDGLRYRTCPRTSCSAVGQYSKGTKISIKCFTRKDTTTVNGDAGWAKLTNGYYVAMAYGKYITWSSTLYAC
ncbi:hypothetical protein N7532_008805 [Penicillium argentinense]|uniref:SH3 domain-containing protein n=1 Tax=Penicillium argentinense TaxID=1131581 RepID=A0A9W9K2D7_9EURO|nr:uncharacterized protein N7532_008805 [Penicillium argentinense]KAJ5090121.1 hypothetical protein N7532_008805 [Penicillium argentinense]